ADNIFIVRGGEVLTPPVTEGGLDGITRQVVLAAAAELHIPHRETPLAPYDLYVADECCLTGTGAELIAGASIDGRSLPRGPCPTFRTLRTAFRCWVTRETKGWGERGGLSAYAWGESGLRVGFVLRDG